MLKKKWDRGHNGQEGNAVDSFTDNGEVNHIIIIELCSIETGPSFHLVYQVLIYQVPIYTNSLS